MIISDRYGFLFVANLRTASSSMHLALGPLASIDLFETGSGKHYPLDEIYRRYGSERISPLFKWAVIRRPTEYLWSLYRFHERAAFDGKPHSTRGRTFEDFYTGDTHGWMKAPQSTRFVDPDGEYALDLLVHMDTLHEGFSYLKFRLGLPNVMLPRINRSGSVGSPRLSHELEERIRADYAADYDCIERYANRERTLDGFQRILESAATAAR
jgi:hypothetical protein